jgi:Cdc6-like AAA superfamily ATPase
MSELIDQKEYEERADFIEEEDLLKWTVKNAFFNDIQNKILQKGAKLIVGPRGTGKTHQMKVAYNKCLNDKSLPLAIYVSFSKYYHLEPFLYKKPNAKKIFHTWILSKILISCYQLLSDLGSQLKLFKDNSLLNQEKLEEFTSQVEKSITQPWHDQIISATTINNVINIIENLASRLKRKRIILLLDDAALTLTPDYLVEFFDVYRSLKTKKIAPKASVYPGTTEYGPRFHPRHDAEEVEAWVSIENENYSLFMDELIEKRFTEIPDVISRDILELFKFAAFGIPRAFIVLLRNYSQMAEQKPQEKFNKVIGNQAKLIKDEYLSLKQKMPQFKSIIEIGYVLFDNMNNLLKQENERLADKNERQLYIGIKPEQDQKIKRMIRFLIEAGLLYEFSSVRHGGSEREYNRYIPHMLFLIQKRAFSPDRGFNAEKIVEFIKRRQTKHPVRREFKTILAEEQLNNIRLDLPKCSHCGAERLTDDQKFCQNCGNQLVGHSTFEKCMQIPIDKLPISQFQIQRIKNQTDFKTVGDIISATAPASELQKAHYIGPIRSEKIVMIAKALVEEFLT